MADINQIKSAETIFKPLGAMLDDAHHALLRDIDIPELWHKLNALRAAYSDALTSPWSKRWKNVWAIPPHHKFRDPDRRAIVNTLRRKVRMAERSLERARRGNSLSEQVQAEVSLTSAKDALSIYQQFPAFLSHDELQSATGA